MVRPTSKLSDVGALARKQPKADPTSAFIGFRRGDPCLEARGGSAVSFLCALVSADRRACGNRRRWSGGDTPGATARVRLARLADSAVSSPGIPCLSAWGEVK